MDINKDTNALDQERFLEILAACGVGPRTLRLLHTYWGQLAMVAKADGYFVCPLKGYQGVTQGNPLYHKMFNVVVYAVIRH